MASTNKINWNIVITDGITYVGNGNDETICEIMGSTNVDTLIKQEANAKLIAAAPELLNFLKEYVILVTMEDTSYSDYEKFSDIAKELIKKATI